jgi:hypothetical protein
MTTTVKSQQEFYTLIKDEVMSRSPDFRDFSPGSMLDAISGAISMLGNELAELIVSEFTKTFFSMAEGDDLEVLAVDHFGDSFAKPDAVKATGLVTFSRPNNSAGDVTINAGTVVKTVKNSAGEEIRFVTDETVLLTGTSISVGVTAVVAGSAGNVMDGKLTVIESALSDPSVTVTNAADMAGGADEFDDAEYLAFIRAKILALAGATEAAVEGAAKAVAGVGFAKLTTLERIVIDFDLETMDILADAIYFRIPYPVIYVADENGNSSQALIDAVKAAIHFVRACGVKVEVKGAVAYEVDWTATVTLNPAGPNFAEFESDLTKVKETMADYITNLAIGAGFVRATANAYILSIWGPSGTGDLTDFSSSVPVGDVAGATGQKLVPGEMEIV